MNTEVQILLRNALDLIQEKQLDEAGDLLHRVLSLDSFNVDALRFLAVIASKKLDHVSALDYINRSIALAPNNAVAYSNKGNILKVLERYQEALDILDISIKLNPNYAEAYNNRANAMLGLYQHEEALDWYDKAILLDPLYADAYSNKGNTLEYLHRYDEAIQYYDKATAINPRHIETYWAKAHAQLSRGDFARGWQNYEARWFRCDGANLLHQDIKRLEGLEDIVGKRVLIWSEQGLGDTLQFCRYISPLAGLGAKVTFIVPRALLRILNSLSDICTLVSEIPDVVENFDFQSPLLSLPLVFGTTLDSIPAETPYLKYDESSKWGFQELIPKSSNFKIGLIWNGGFRPDQPDLLEINRRRNIDLEVIARIQNIPGVDFYSLQKGEPAESELLDRKSDLWPNIINCANWLNDFSDTAALMGCLDLIISVDTSSAHLAGALGKPVWILNRYDSCWRWLKGRVDSPWYPTAKLYQQGSPGDWIGVINSVRHDLEILVAQKALHCGS